MKPTEVKSKDDWIQYLIETINQKDQYIKSLLEQIGKLIQSKEDVDKLHPFDYSKTTIPGNWLQTYNQLECPKCKLHLKGAVGYSCPHSDCPTGLGPIICDTTK